MTSKLIAKWLPDAEQHEGLEQVRRSTAPTIILDSRDWVLGNSRLPVTWDLTSDSISAAVASELNAEELVLLKSCLPEDSELEYCDPLFSQIVTTKRVRFVSLKSNDFDEVSHVVE